MKLIELARELRKPARELIKVLSMQGIKVKKPASKLNERSIKILRDLYSTKKVSEAVVIETDGPIIIKKGDKFVVKDFADKMGIELSTIMKAILELGFLLNMNSAIENDVAVKIGEKLGVEIKVEKEIIGQDQTIKDQVDQIRIDEIDADPETLVERPPVITIMGHVDHGKTLLLDTIRKSNVVAEEKGGITQHIGAYQVEFSGKKLTFLDTPGHAAFTAIRARGSQLTDITILVVAADEGVKPQTEEAIHHAKAANVPIIVALNKIDKPDANIEQVKQELAKHDLVAEDWGGKTIMVPLSAKSGKGIDDLLDMLVLVSEMLELKAVSSGDAKAIVIESKLSRKKGPVATVLVKTGVLKVGDSFSLGSSSGKVRALVSDSGDMLNEALPGRPVEILGISDVPSPGDLLEVLNDEKKLKAIVEKKRLLDADVKKKAVTGASLESLAKKVELGETGQLKLILKGDVNGSLEAIAVSVSQLESEDIAVSIVHSATGQVTENDVMLAAASQSMIIAFNVDVGVDIQQLADENSIEIKSYGIIYKIIEDIEKTLSGMFTPEIIEIEIGRAQVRQVYSFSKLGFILGSHVSEGKMIRNSTVRVYRENKETFSGKLTSLKRFKDDVKEVLSGFECGIVLDGIKDVKEGDVIASFMLEEVK